MTKSGRRRVDVGARGIDFLEDLFIISEVLQSSTTLVWLPNGDADAVKMIRDGLCVEAELLANRRKRQSGQVEPAGRSNLH